MNINFLRLLFVFIILIFFQDLVVDKLPFGTYICPEVYTIFILLLPFNYSPVSTLVWAFAMGLCIDVFSMGVIGLHSAALLVLAYMRTRILKIVSQKDDMESIAIPSTYTLGFRPFVTYVILSLLVHNTILFFLDTFNFNYFFHLLIRIALSTVVTTLFIVLMQLTFSPRRR